MRNLVKALFILVAVMTLVSCNNLFAKVEKPEENEIGEGNSLKIILPFYNQVSRSISRNDIGSYRVTLYTVNTQPGEQNREYELTVTPDNPTAVFTNLPAGTYQVHVSGYQAVAGASGEKMIIAEGYSQDNLNVTDNQSQTVEINMHLSSEWRYIISTGSGQEKLMEYSYTMYVGDGSETNNYGYLWGGEVYWSNADYSTVEKDGKTLYLCGWTKNKQYDAMTAENYETIKAQIESDGNTVYQLYERISITDPAKFYSLYCESTEAHKVSTIKFKNLMLSEDNERTIYCLPEVTSLQNPPEYHEVFRIYDETNQDYYWVKDGEEPTENTVIGWDETIPLEGNYTDPSSKTLVINPVKGRQIGRVTDSYYCNGYHWYFFHVYSNVDGSYPSTLDISSYFDNDGEWLFSSDEDKAGDSHLYMNPDLIFDGWNWSEGELVPDENGIITVAQYGEFCVRAIWRTAGTRYISDYAYTPSVGDILFKDDSYTPISEINARTEINAETGTKLTPEEKERAFAVVFFVGSEENTALDASDFWEDNVHRILCVGLEIGTGKAWCSTEASGYTTDFTDTPLATSGTGSAGQYTAFSGNTNGYLSYFLMIQGLSDNDTSESSDAERYPVFDYVNKYKETNNLNNLTCGNRWFLPTVAEMYQLWNVKSVVDESFALCGMDNKIGTYPKYYTSSTPEGNDMTGKALMFTMESGEYSPVPMDETGLASLAVIDFHYQMWN